MNKKELNEQKKQLAFIKGNLAEIDKLYKRLGEQNPFAGMNAEDFLDPSKFKELSCGALAKWMIKSRKGNMQKIVGSLNQQYVFNRKKNPSYAKKMVCARNKAKQLLNGSKKN